MILREVVSGGQFRLGVRIGGGGFRVRAENTEAGHGGGGNRGGNHVSEESLSTTSPFHLGWGRSGWGWQVGGYFRSG